MTIFRWRVLLIIISFLIIGAVCIGLIVFYQRPMPPLCMQYGNGTTTDPYRIYNPVQLHDLIMQTTEQYALDGKHFKLMNDIDYTNYVALSDSNFSGVLDGNGMTISGIQHPLFRTLQNNAVIKNLNVEGDIIATIRASSTRYGAIAELICENALVSNCTSSCNFSVDLFKEKYPTKNDSLIVGGVVGTNNGIIKDCAFDGTITKIAGKNTMCKSYIGGIAAFGTGRTENCLVSGAIDYSICEHKTWFFGISPGIANNCIFSGRAKFIYNFDRSDHNNAKLLELAAKFYCILIAPNAKNGRFAGSFIADFNGFLKNSYFNVALTNETSNDIECVGSYVELNIAN